MVIDWDVIRNEYIQSGGTVALKDLAEKYKVKDSTLRSRKNREKWDNYIDGNVATVKATKAKKVATKSKVQRNTLSSPPQNIVKALDKISTNNELNEKQQMFCTYFVKYWNSTKAYQKAYDCDYIVAQKNAYRLMVHDGVKAEIERLKKVIRDSIIIEPMMILQKYADIAFADMEDYAEWGNIEIPVTDFDGNLIKDETGRIIMRPVNYVRVKDHTQVDGTIITEISQGKDGVKVKLADRMKALEKLEQYFDVIPDEWKRKVEIKKLEIEQQKLEVLKDKNNYGMNDDKDSTGVVFLPPVKEGDE